MRSKEELFAIYKGNQHTYTCLEEEVRHIINHGLTSEGIKVHSVLSRIKEFESFCTKSERKNNLNPFDEITDIVGIRIVCLFKSDIEKIGKVIAQNFEIISEDNKIDDFEQISSFGYMSFHYVCQMNENFHGPRYDQIKDIKFEIQLRTISMDAWANISHYLDYKTEKDIPKELKKDFHALSGLFYVADSHFEFFVKSIHETQNQVEQEVKLILENIDHESSNEELSFDSLKSYLNQKFSDRYTGDSKNISLLLEELLKADYKYLSQLDDAVSKSEDAFKLYETKHPPGSAEKYNAIGVIRLSLSIIDEKYRDLIPYPSITLVRFQDSEVQNLIN